jgi:hypothetical protein
MDSQAQTPDTATLEATLKNYVSDREAYKMIEGEFKVDKDKVDEILDKAKNDLFSLLPDARDMAEALMRGAESEAIRWQVTKYILDYGLKGGEAEDTMERLVNSLKKKSTT